VRSEGDSVFSIPALGLLDLETEACGGEGDGYEDRIVVPSEDAILHPDEDDAESGVDDDECHQDAGYPHHRRFGEGGN
jgi:hypothetical protein